MKANELQVFIDQMNSFIEHNINIGNISSNTTIQEFKDGLLKGISENFIPIFKEIENKYLK